MHEPYVLGIPTTQDPFGVPIVKARAEILQRLKIATRQPAKRRAPKVSHSTLWRHSTGRTDAEFFSFRYWNVESVPDPVILTTLNARRVKFGNLYSVHLNPDQLAPVLLTAKEPQPYGPHAPPGSRRTTAVDSPWSTSASENEKMILYDLVDSGRHDVAQRLSDLIGMYASDPDVEGLNLASLKSIAEFFKRNGNLRPAIVAGWDGALAVEWKLPPTDPHGGDQTCGGILGLEFLPDGQIEFLGFVKSDSGGQRIEYDGTAGLDNIISEISSFLQRM